MTRRFVALLWLWVVGWASVVHAATYDPDLRYRTLVTEHFRVHFHQGLEPLAERLSHALEEVFDTMTAELAWTPRGRTEVVLIDPTDRANGFATAVPYRSITMFVTAPQEDATLSLHDDWPRTLALHEFTHVLHLETHRGIVSAARAIVGRIASTNTLSPKWIIEGLATFHETNHTAGGRGRSPFVEMIKRAAVLDDDFPPLGNLDGFQAELPAGNLRYLFGEDFMRFIADHTGRDVWTTWTHRYGGHVPYLLPTRRVFGTSLRRLYRAWRDDLTERTQEAVAATTSLGVREGRPISPEGQSCNAPAFSPNDHHLIFTCTSPKTGNALWIAETDGSGARLLKQDIGAKTFTWRRDSKAFAYAVTHTVNRFNTWSDLYLFDLERQTVRPLTRGQRARDPAWSPDGSQLWFVTNRAGHTRLMRRTVDGVDEVVHQPPGADQVATPAFHPSGRVVAVSLWREGFRDLWLLDAGSGEPIRRLTATSAIDRDPAWSPDGQTLFFTSDRTGVPQIHAIDLERERLWQVTNVTTGAARPHVRADGEILAYAQYRSTGWEIRLLDLDPNTWIDRGPLPRLLAQDHAELPPLTTAPPAPQRGDPLWSDAPDPPPGLPRIAVDPFARRPLPGLTAVGPADVRDPGALTGLPTRAIPPRSALHPRQDNAPIGSYAQIEVDDPWGPANEDFPFTAPVRRYDPSASLLPRYWVPSIGLTPRLPPYEAQGPFSFLRQWPAPFDLPGFTATASTAATDPLRRWGWSAWGGYRTDANAGRGGGQIILNRWLPVLTFTGGTDAVPYTYQSLGPWHALTEDGEPRFTRDDLRATFLRESTASVRVSWPFTVRSTLFGSYGITVREAPGGVPDDAYLPSLALRGTIGNLQVGYRYQWAQPTARAISPEDARSLVATATLTAPWLGTFAVEEDGSRRGITQLLLSADWREFLVNPLAPNHVFVLRGGVGVAFGGADRFLGNYQIGGNGVGAFRALRGYPAGARRGDTYWLTGLAYRMPLWRMDRGLGTLPVFFRFLAAEFFVEAGDAFDRVASFVDVFNTALVGAGAELRLATLVSWGAPFDFRVGYGVGVTPGGFGPVEPGAVYLRFNANL